MEGEGGESGGDGGREWSPHCRPLTSCSRCPVIVLYRRRVVIMVPRVSKLGWDELGTGDAHRSFGCHVAAGDMAPASLVSVGRVRWLCLCVCASVCVRFGVVVAVVFIVGGVVAMVASWSEVGCQWGLLVVVRLEGMVSEDSQV